MKLTTSVAEAFAKAEAKKQKIQGAPVWQGKTLSLTGENVTKVVGGPPVKPPQVKLFEEFQPARGIYLVTSETGIGKTATLMGLVMYANAIGVPATYVSVFEPRETEGAGTYFQAGRNFSATLEKVCLHSSVLRIFAIDSITGPLKDFSSTYPDQSTFAGGMQPSDRAFLVEGARRMVQSNLIGLWAVNKQLVPYVDDLSGSTEGLIEVLQPGVFRFHDRTPQSKRKKGAKIVIPADIMQEVFTLLS